MEFSYKINETQDGAVIRMSGNLIEKSQAIELMERVDEIVSKGPSQLAVDMTGFKYMNSTGLNVLVQILTKSRKSGGDTVLFGVPDNIRSLMLITKLTNIFTISDSEEDAVKALSKTA
jgi:anti-sigma B factor antagonist